MVIIRRKELKMTKDNLVQAVADRDEGQCDQLHSEAKGMAVAIAYVLSTAPPASERSEIAELVHSALLFAVKREREACADIADESALSISRGEGGEIWIASKIASSIRARGEPHDR